MVPPWYLSPWLVPQCYHRVLVVFSPWSHHVLTVVSQRSHRCHHRCGRRWVHRCYHRGRDVIALRYHLVITVFSPCSHSVLHVFSSVLSPCSHIGLDVFAPVVSRAVSRWPHRGLTVVAMCSHGVLTASGITLVSRCSHRGRIVVSHARSTHSACIVCLMRVRGVFSSWSQCGITCGLTVCVVSSMCSHMVISPVCSAWSNCVFTSRWHHVVCSPCAQVCSQRVLSVFSWCSHGVLTRVLTGVLTGVITLVALCCRCVRTVSSCVITVSVIAVFSRACSPVLSEVSSPGFSQWSHRGITEFSPCCHGVLTVFSSCSRSLPITLSLAL